MDRGLKPIRVLLVDDSAVVRQVLAQALSADQTIQVIAAVADPVFAMARMQREWPDVIVLDVEMPRMDGLTFLRKIMEERPTPVIICSTLTERGAATTLEALAAGAVSIVTKPKLGLKQFLQDSSASLIGAVRAAAAVDMRKLQASLQPPPQGGRFEPLAGSDRAPGGASAKQSSTADAAAPSVGISPATLVGTRTLHRLGPKLSADAMLTPRGPRAMQRTTERVVALGTSTGGTQALERVLTALPRACPGIVVVQHMPEKFTAAFAERLNRLCEIEVREARQGERLLPGHALIAPGGRHLMLRRSGAYYYAEVVDGPLVNRHKPSVDVLFRSVAKCAGSNAIGIIMTGMGDDGARGLREMRDAGAATYAQDEASCVVFGMPKEAIRMDAVQQVLPLTALPRAILSA